jgi:hypothetical protein
MVVVAAAYKIEINVIVESYDHWGRQDSVFTLECLPFLRYNISLREIIMEFTSELIGCIERGIDGTDIYRLVKTDVYATLAEVEGHFRDLYCFSSNYPGAKFCDTVVAVPCKHRQGHEFIVTIFERYDN